MHPAIRAKARSRADCHTRTPAPVVHARVAARATADDMLMHKQAASPHMRMLRIVQVRFRYIYANLLFSHTYGCEASIHIPPRREVISTLTRGGLGPFAIASGHGGGTCARL